MDAIAIYRERFQPSDRLVRPYVTLGFNVFAADTEAQAHRVATSAQQAFVNLRSGRPGRLPPPREGYLQQVGELAEEHGPKVLSAPELERVRAESAHGKRATKKFTPQRSSKYPAYERRIEADCDRLRHRENCRLRHLVCRACHNPSTKRGGDDHAVER
jgi:alkanesulfonate monooxygenase SsuD/methylene tetrahydromethanopterin reductase-like flavin-dependent oxidoreductase (luciferase family)